MIVEITNLTDGPEKTPTEISLFNKTLSPGDSLKVYAALIDKKTRSLEEAGLISIGQIPPWYAAFKAKNKGRVLTRAEFEAQLITPVPTPRRATAPEPASKLRIPESPKKKG